MPTIIFDFDSTLVECESLDLILQAKLKNRPDAQKQVHALTTEGIKGAIPFSESLARRLEIAAPNREEVEAFGQRAISMITSGMAELTASLKNEGVDLWVVSGGLYESLLPACKHLGIAEPHILAVKLIWGSHGEFLGIDPHDPFSHSKVKGASQIAFQWKRPRIVVGDAMSDYRLFEQQIAEYFVLYTGHLECSEIVAFGVETAKNTQELREKIDAFIRQEKNQSPPSRRN